MAKYGMSRWDKKVRPMTPAEKRRIAKDLIPAKKKLHIMLKQYRAKREKQFDAIAKSIHAVLDSMANVMALDRIQPAITKIAKLYVKNYKALSNVRLGIKQCDRPKRSS